MKLGNNPSGVNKRRQSALIRLSVNLKDNKTRLATLNSLEPNDQADNHIQKIVDIERDNVRISNEMAILQGRIVPDEMAQLKRTKKRR